VIDMQESKELFPCLLEDMKRVAQRIEAQLEYDITITGTDYLDRLKPRIRVDLFLFYKECLINICRHSGATRLRVHLSADPKEITLAISDNGQGFSSPAESRIPHSLERRAKLLGAKPSVESSETGGTCITLKIGTWGRLRRRTLTLET